MRLRVAMYLLVAAVLIGVGIWAQRPMNIPMSGNAGVPISDLAHRQPVPQIGLMVPLAPWIVLPQSGRAITASVAPPQPPYGIASSVTLTIDETGEEFLAAYQRRLESAGFAVRQVPAALAPTDMADARIEAVSRNHPHSVFVAVRSVKFVQLTFWDGPTPRR